jgi:hypothetical protein
MGMVGRVPGSGIAKCEGGEMSWPGKVPRAGTWCRCRGWAYMDTKGEA